MASREQLTALATGASRAFRTEMDVVAKLSLAVKQIAFLTHTRAEDAGKLSRMLANRDIPLEADQIDKRATALTSQSADLQLTAAYEALMKVIEELPIASRTAAVASLREALHPGASESG